MNGISLGDRVVAVEHDDATRQPKPGGLRIPGTVMDTPGIYVLVLYDDPQYRPATPHKFDQFYAESLWRAWDGGFSWRLEAAA